MKKSRDTSILNEEEITAMGQESDTKAAKWVIEKGKEDQKEQEKERAIVDEILNSAKKKRFTYRNSLLKVIHKQQQDFPIPQGFSWGCYGNTIEEKHDGIIIWFKDPRGNVAQVAMKVSGIPKYDLNWIDRRINDTLDLMDKIEDNSPTTKSGIILA